MGLTLWGISGAVGNLGGYTPYTSGTAVLIVAHVAGGRLGKALDIAANPLPVREKCTIDSLFALSRRNLSTRLYIRILFVRFGVWQIYQSTIHLPTTGAFIW